MTRRWLERAAAPTWWPIERKAKKFITVPVGPHSAGIPLTVVVRDVLQLAATGREAAKAIKAGKILIDGRKMRDPGYGIGPMDILTIPELGKSWRLVPAAKLALVETAGADASLKLCRVNGKRIVKGGRLQIALHDGRTLLAAGPISTADSLLLKVPEQAVVGHIKLEPGALVLVTAGAAIGQLARLKSVERQLGRAWLTVGKRTFEVPLAAVFAIGSEKPAVKLVGE